MGRRAAAEAVAAITPFDERERVDRDEARAWIASGVNIHRIAKPDVPPKHLVAYFVVIDPTAGATLLVDHRLAGLWLPPGGHVDPGEFNAVQWWPLAVAGAMDRTDPHWSRFVAKLTAELVPSAG